MTDVQGRYPIDPPVVQRAVKLAPSAARVSKQASCHSSVRPSFAPHLLERGRDILTIQEWLGRKDVSTT